ncbi:MAG: sel1 repeat family protein [Clostridium sp.]|nr:sel1 repeat family protein [Bacteroidales bacterium]MCM1207263.1 sel1 repeat family protein [Bacillota bacterium]MCM1500120.1 sel1 repeat family protein [Clostridium sp.]
MRGRLYFLAILLAFTVNGSAQRQDSLRGRPSERQLLIMARQYRLGIMREANPEKAVRIYRYLAAKNNAKAMNELGKCCLNGDGIRKNARAAAVLFMKAAKLGSREAKCNLALIWQKGLHGVADYQRAYALYREVADSGSVQGLYGAGYLMYKGLGVKQDYAGAVRLLEQGGGLRGSIRDVACCWRHTMPTDMAGSRTWRKRRGSGAWRRETETAGRWMSRKGDSPTQYPTV